MDAARKQDLPPPGGYEKIIFERNPARVLFKGRYIMAAYLGVSATAMYLYNKEHRKIMRDRQERQSGINAVFPFLMAERDRAYLKRLHYNREIEAETMKNVPNWEVGTYYGEPIYKTVNPEETWVDPCFEDFYCFVTLYDWQDRGMKRLNW